jgi:hypothetical protein
VKRTGLPGRAFAAPSTAPEAATHERQQWAESGPLFGSAPPPMLQTLPLGTPEEMLLALGRRHTE